MHINKLKSIFKNDNIWSFINLDPSFAKLVKINNCVEQFHSNLEAVCKQHRTYNTRQSLYREIIQKIERYNSNRNEATNISDNILEDTNPITEILAQFKQSEYIILKVISSGRKVIDQEIDNATYLRLKKLLK